MKKALITILTLVVAIAILPMEKMTGKRPMLSKRKKPDIRKPDKSASGNLKGRIIQIQTPAEVTQKETKTGVEVTFITPFGPFGPVWFPKTAGSNEVLAEIRKRKEAWERDGRNTSRLDYILG